MSRQSRRSNPPATRDLSRIARASIGPRDGARRGGSTVSGVTLSRVAARRRTAIPTDVPTLDGRLWHPSPTPVARTLAGKPARVRVYVSPKPPRRQSRELEEPQWHQVAFVMPAGVGVCVRRHERREVLMATGAVGRGAKVRRPGRLGPSSKVVCK